jgi:circadian clock protein KaiB
MNMESSPRVFKGIAVFTPGGDLVYCVDTQKQARWHVHLCGVLQHWLELAEPPHFLIPCYTATVDRVLDPQTQEIYQVAEASPFVMRYQWLLNAVFGTRELNWSPFSLRPEICDPVILATYRAQFPQLWESHDWVVRYEPRPPAYISPSLPHLQTSETSFQAPLVSSSHQGYVLRLFVSGHSVTTERTLQRLYNLLEQLLNQPYTLKVIDVSQQPEQAELDQVTATPTLVRVWPLPVRRIVGNLDHVDQLLGVLSFPTIDS